MALEKKCITCEKTKLETDYYKNYGTCKECIKARQRERNKLDKTKVIPKGSKTCKRCGKEKDNSQFRPNRAQCGDCEREYGRGYNQTHQSKRKEWVENNKERMTELQANWYQKNKGKINNLYKEKYKYDILFKIDRNLRKNILNKVSSIKLGLPIKNETSHLKSWLELNFPIDKKIEWSNHGTYWNIDHVIPPKFFNIVKKEERELCYSWVNLMPLTRNLNRIKSDKINEILVYHQLNSLAYFLTKINKKYSEIIKNYTSKAKSIISNMRDTL